MGQDFSGQKALVTGGASGIGLATARALAERGARVAVNFLTQDAQAQETVCDLAANGLDVIPAPGDVSDRQSAEAMVATAVDGLGGLSILVNNAGTAGGPQPVPFAELDRLDDAFWGAVVSTNLLGPFWCTRAAAKALSAERGSVVNTASIAGLGRRGSSLAYAASKAGLISLTRSLAVALAPHVRVNAVAPGFVQTGWTKGWSSDAAEQAIASSLLQRAATPQDIANVMIFLAIPGSYVNAQTIVVDGGQA